MSTDTLEIRSRPSGTSLKSAIPSVPSTAFPKFESYRHHPSTLILRDAVLRTAPRGKVECPHRVRLGKHRTEHMWSGSPRKRTFSVVQPWPATPRPRLPDAGRHAGHFRSGEG